MMTIPYQELINLVSQILWPLPRISGLFLSMPVFSSVMLPKRIRLTFILVLAFVVSPSISTQLSLLHFKGGDLLVVAFELLLGLLMGFVIQLVFQVFVIGGQIISMQAGLGFATMVDPASRSSVPLISHFYMMLVTLMFLSLNGHLVMLDTLISSFQTMPVGSSHAELKDIGAVLQFSGWMFKQSVLVALPAILALLIVSLSFGVMARVAPQLNIFSLGFPITLLMGMIILRVSLPGVASQIADSLEQGMLLIKGLIR